MMYRAIIIYVAVQAVVISSPTPSQHGESIVSPISSGTFYHPTPASRARNIPEVSKIPKPFVTPKKIPTRLSPGNYASRKNRITILDPHQPSKLHNNHIHLDESHHKTRQLSSNDEKTEKLNSDLEKMIQFMTILGQVDRYLSSRAKSFVSTLGRAMEGNPIEQDIYNDRDIMSSLEY